MSWQRPCRAGLPHLGAGMEVDCQTGVLAQTGVVLLLSKKVLVESKLHDLPHIMQFSNSEIGCLSCRINAL